jgi:signal-transduction protein with cAMP-binding, CBS, and nucleotidyltransferase domain
MATHRNLVQSLNETLAELRQATSATSLKKLTVAFYSDLYRHFGHFRSAPVFYKMSISFLQQISAIIIELTKEQIGTYAGHLPEIALIAVGPAGRCEYSPFCQLQLLLLHKEVPAAQLQTLNLFCTMLHDAFEEAGIAVDALVTPRNPDWRGTLSEWQQRSEAVINKHDDDDDLINLCRLEDQTPLYPVDDHANELKRNSYAVLCASRPALANLIERMKALSNGLGIMGGFKLERSGSEKSVFKLIDHGLLPLSAALSALALIKKSSASSSSDRVHDLLRRGEVDVDMAERILETWHNLHNLRLHCEQSFNLEEHVNQTLCLNPGELSAEQRHSLKETLESVAVIQRYVEIVFSSMEG